MIAVLIWLSILTSKKEGTLIRSCPLGVRYPLAIAIDLIAWFSAPAPIEWICALSFSFKILTKAPATKLGLDLDIYQENPEEVVKTLMGVNE